MTLKDILVHIDTARWHPPRRRCHVWSNSAPISWSWEPTTIRACGRPSSAARYFAAHDRARADGALINRASAHATIALDDGQCGAGLFYVICVKEHRMAV